MYWVEGSSRDELTKPVFNTDPEAAKLVDWLADGPKPGWLRIGADLLGLDGSTQRKLINNIQRLVDRTRSDSRAHSLTPASRSSYGKDAYAPRQNHEGAIGSAGLSSEVISGIAAALPP